jgi:predicted N-acyltransferase
MWSTVDFRRVAAELPQHELAHLVAEVDGQPVLAAAVLHSTGPGGLLFYDVPAMIGDERAFGPGVPPLAETDRAALYPSLAVGVYGAHHGVVVARHATARMRRDLCGELPAAVSAMARELGCASSAVLYATPELARLLRPAPGQVPAVLGAESRLEPAAADFDGYLAQLSARRRARVLRERRRYLDGPVRSEITTGGDALGDDLVDLRCRLRRRYGLPEQRRHTEAEFAALARWCGPMLVVNRSVVDGATVGFVVDLRHGDTLFARTAGFDYDRVGSSDFCYFNVVYYDMLAWALPRGVRAMEFGLASYPGKRTRGCRFEPRYGLFDLPAQGPARAVLAAQDTAEWDRLVAECGDGLDTTGGRPWT